MCDQSGGEVGHRRHQTTEQSVGDGGSGTTNDWRATIGRRWRIMDEQESARDGRKMIGDDRRPEEPQSEGFSLFTLDLEKCFMPWEVFFGNISLQQKVYILHT
ncbi:hypothetical protein E3N88_32578 [Mikania micrantha]|uniref:Uncharacterized protein n=1 Tax=Mikania micrantha TaxID=192012 RepID=A0A5N6MBG7_9ASTR|nr:hypothetical protein E3N88_32578 [Mikania micrantha]